jgi:hypothetical protein
MDRRAIHKAIARVRIAEKAIHRMRRARSRREMAEDWVVFLLAWKAVYTTLETGSKASAQSRQWFGSIKAERKMEPMLDYLFHARNDDEHGLDKSAQSRTLMHWPCQPDQSYSAHVTDIDGERFVTVRDGSGNVQELVQSGPPFLALVPITLRGGIVLDPPEKWEGLLIYETSVNEIAPLALIHSKRILGRAIPLRTPSRGRPALPGKTSRRPA